MRQFLVKHLWTAGFVLLLAGIFFYLTTSQFDWRAQLGIYAGAALLILDLALHWRFVWQSLASRQGRHGSMAGATVLLVAGILVLVNFLNFKNSKKFDLTEAGLYGLSEQSRQVVANLNDDLHIIGFFTESPDSRPAADRFRELMDNYSEASSRFAYEVVDPEEDLAAAALYEVRRSGQAVLECGGKKETVSLTTFQGDWQPDNEERITNAIIKVTRGRDKHVYFLLGHGERDIEDSGEEGFKLAADALRKQNYQVETWNLAEQSKLPDDVDVLISAGPQVNFLPAETELIRQYLAQGGKFFLLVDPQTVFDMNKGFLDGYGLLLQQDLVLDISAAGQLLGAGPVAPVAASYADHPITSKLERFITFYPRAQSIQTGESSLGYSVVQLVQTGPQSWGETDIEAEEVQFDEGVDHPGPITLAAASTKEITLPEAEDAEPPSDGQATAEASAAAAEEPDGSDEGSPPEDQEEAPKSRESRLVLFGDSDFATNLYFANTSSRNGDLFLFAVQWMAEDADLLAIRPRSQTDRRVNLTVGQSQFMFWATAVLIPLATLVVGFMVWNSRR